MAEKNWPKSVKKCPKEPKFVFRARAPLPAEGPAAGATKVGLKALRRRRLGCRPKAGKLVIYKLSSKNLYFYSLNHG